MLPCLVLDQPPLLAASLWHVLMKARLLSAVTCPTLPEWPLKLEFPYGSLRPLTLPPLHFRQSLWFPWGTYQWHKTISHASFWKLWKPSKGINHSVRLLKCPVQTMPARIFEEPTQGGYCMHIQINDTIQWFNTICQVKLLQSSCAHLKWCLAQLSIHKSAAACFPPIKRAK